MNILVTGAKGFVGKHLVPILTDNGHAVYEFNRGDSVEIMSEYIDNIDLIYHLAAEVNPKASDIEFTENNTNLTKNIVGLMVEKSASIPIVFLSSIHAENPQNLYGRTKLESEITLQSYSDKADVSLTAYRLPHLYGPNCKPNYNSVISTWIYNTINNIPCTVYDDQFEIEYLFIGDLCEMLLSETTALNSKGYVVKNISDNIKSKIKLRSLLNLINKIVNDGQNFKPKTMFEINLMRTISSYINDK